MRKWRVGDQLRNALGIDGAASGRLQSALEKTARVAWEELGGVHVDLRTYILIYMEETIQAGKLLSWR